MKDNGQPLIPYLRQSRAKERTISIEEQRRDIRKWAEGASVELATEVVEQNVSGSKPWRERGIGEAIAACERGEVSGVIVAWQDRLSREHGLATAEVWEALDKAGARLVCAAEGMDTATGDHEMLFAIRAAVAREQWKRYRANWQGARRNGVESGAYPTKTPFGYGRDEAGRLVVNDDNAVVIRRIFHLRAEGLGVAAIGHALEAVGFRSPKGGPSWSHSTISQILRNRVYLGEQKHGEFAKENAHKAIVSEREFSAAQVAKTLRTPEPRMHSAGALAVGLARCAGCGHTLKIVMGYGRPRYYCKGPYASGPCPARCLIRVDELDPYVEGWFLSAVKGNVRVASAVRANRRAVETQRALDEAEAQVTEYAKHADALGAHFLVGLEERQRALELARLDHAEASAEQRLYGDMPSGDMLASWPQLSIQRRRQLLAAYVDTVRVKRAPSRTLPVAKRVQFLRDGVLIAPEQVREVLSQDR
jgi:DNA invertase Pin-like site-specific DNA recombinase